MDNLILYLIQNKVEKLLWNFNAKLLFYCHLVVVKYKIYQCYKNELIYLFFMQIVSLAFETQTLGYFTNTKRHSDFSGLIDLNWLLAFKVYLLIYWLYITK